MLRVVRPFVLGLLCLTLGPGCGAQVFDYVGDRPATHAPSTLPATVVLNALAFPHTRVEVVLPNALRGETVGDPRFEALEERLLGLFSESEIGRSTTASIDLGSTGAEEPAFVVQYAVRSYQSGGSPDAAGAAGAWIFVILTGGLFTPVICAITNRIEHRFTVEVRVYRADESSLVSLPDRSTGERVSQYDTSGATALLRESYDLEIESGHPACSQPSGNDLFDLNRAEGRQMARRIFSSSASAVYRAINAELGRAPSRPTSTSSSTGGEALPAPPPPPLMRPNRDSSTEVETRIRTRLDQRAARILLCAGMEAAAVRATWSQSGEVLLRFDGLEEESRIACAQVAFGSLIVPTGTVQGELVHAIERP